MKINQLFIRYIDKETLVKVLHCFGLKDLEDKKMFSKNDLVQAHTVVQLNEMKPLLESFYLPCKAKIYIDNLNEKKAITVLKQLLRLHGHVLVSKERNINNKKVIFYCIVNENEKDMSSIMKMQIKPNVLDFS